MKTQQIVLVSRPIGTPTLENFRFEEIVLDKINEGEVLLQGLYYSVDPYMRGRMNDIKSYISPFQLNEPIEGGVVARVLASKDEQFKIGEIVLGSLPWRIQTVASTKYLQKIDPTLAPLTYYLGVLGMPGLTAYFGLLDIGQPKEGKTIVISGAAGAVGVVVGQIAKIMGSRVIGIAGSDQKTDLIKDVFGFDEAINYKKTPNMKAVISELCPEGVDIYFDNVGGEISDAVIQNINYHARIPLCGQISLYNSTEFPVGPRLQPMLLRRSVLMQGFIVNDYKSQFPDAILQLSKWVKDGQLKYTETIIQGFSHLPSALLGLFKGDNIGKMIVEA
ncbi:MAG: NADP-dependent oxidoreductase [Paludibacter sp.]|nr:NADP-dependent oxidoreductase [Paludibacter sp.]